MFFKKFRHSSNNDAIVLLKYALLTLLLILTPITLFLTSYAWYYSLEFNDLNDDAIIKTTLFYKNALIFGTVGLMSFLLYFLVFLGIHSLLKRVEYKWKKVIFLLAIFSATIFFLFFEIFSAIVIDYLYTWEISLVLTFWPLIYVLLLVLLLINYFEFYNENKNANKLSETSNKEESTVLRDRTEFIA